MTGPPATIAAVSPAITVAAVTESEGRFLVVEERIDQRTVFNQPAGHVEHGESLLQAVVREVREETAWRFNPTTLVGIYRWANPRTGQATMRFAFSGTVDDHDPSQPLDPDILRTHWLSQAELVARSTRLRSPLVLRCIEDYRQGLRQPLESAGHLTLATAAALSAVIV